MNGYGKADMPQIQVVRTFDAIRVLFDGVLHLHITRSELLGVQSWVRQSQCRWFIEYTMRGGVITCDYDGVEKWHTILEQLAEQL